MALSHNTCNQVLHDGMVKALTRLVEEEFKRIYNITPPDILADARSQLDQLRKDNRHEYLHITINPDTTKLDSVEQFVELLKDFDKYRWVGEFSFAIESRSSTVEEATQAMPKGLHAHMLIHRARRQSPSTIRDGLFRGMWKRYCGYKEHIHITPVSNSDSINIKSYLMGVKKDKVYNEHFDNEMREHHRLQANYNFKANNYIAENE